MSVKLPNIFTGQGSEGLSVVEVAPETGERLVEIWNALQNLIGARNKEYGAPASVTNLADYKAAKVAATTSPGSSVEVARQAVIYSLDEHRPAEAQPVLDIGQDAKIYDFPPPIPQASEFRAPTHEEAEQLRLQAASRAAVAQAHLEIDL
jgi:hypothetical protein